MALWIKNTKGRPDSMLTISLLGFAVVLFKFILSGVTMTLFGHEVNFGTVDAATVAAILTPTLGSYVARRYTDNRYVTTENPNTVDVSTTTTTTVPLPGGPLPDVPEPTPPNGAQNAG
ncbi:MAG: hypothetical protein ACYDHY_07600 [Acidiferrobacterales bacterium]